MSTTKTHKNKNIKNRATIDNKNWNILTVLHECKQYINFLLFGSFDQHLRKFDTNDEVLRFHDHLSTLTYPVQTINAISCCWILSLSNKKKCWRGLWFICQYCLIPGSFSVWFNIVTFKSSIYQFIFIQFILC